ncbi:MAG: D-TA family PLP-dependent enzyme, partial [Flavobacteriaceae bacterium]|nr:D-TA family PLP-dependent enzyme [Flavobacteriaceae bacterium]
MRNWYDIDTIDEVDSPSLVLYEERLNFNLGKMLEMVNDDPSKLMPHIKTNKTAEVIRQMVNLGIKRFKASTIAEAELAAREGADSVLVAHQLVGPKINRFIALIQHFPTTKFAAILDNTDSLLALEKEAMNSNVSIDVYIDINNGMDRTGIEIGQGLNELIDQIKTSNTLKFKGLHIYDGQFRDPDYDDRHAQVESAMQQVLKLYEDLK